MLDYNTVQDFFYAYTHAVNKITKTPTKEAWNDIAVRSRVGYSMSATLSFLSRPLNAAQIFYQKLCSSPSIRESLR